MMTTYAFSRRSRIVFLALVFLCLYLPYQTLSAEEVKQNINGLTLNANLELAGNNKLSDGVVLIVHGLLQHNRMEIIYTLQDLFKEQGINSLAINYSYSINDRHGPFQCTSKHQHTREDAQKEIGYWVSWLKKKGVKKIALSGHSSGANEVAMYAATNPDPSIIRVVMITPATVDHSAYTREGYRIRYNKDLDPLLAKATKLIDNGEGDTVMPKTDFMYCASAPVSAKSFVSYYGSRSSSIRLLPAQLKHLPVPGLIVTGTDDQIAPDSHTILTPYVDNKRIKMFVVEGGTHFLRDFDLMDTADAIAKFLREGGAV